MTGRQIGDKPVKAPKTGRAQKAGKATNGDADPAEAATHVPDPDTAAAKASVHEAIGKLIGDDAERRRGTADKEASGIASGKPHKPRSP